jgi:hypothetical protein
MMSYGCTTSSLKQNKLAKTESIFIIEEEEKNISWKGYIDHFLVHEFHHSERLPAERSTTNNRIKFLKEILMPVISHTQHQLLPKGGCWKKNVSPYLSGHGCNNQRTVCISPLLTLPYRVTILSPYI